MKRYGLIAASRTWLWISVATIVVSAIVIVAVRPTWGIDFTGGSLLEISAPAESATQARDVIQTKFGLTSTVQPTQEGALLIRTSALSNEQRSDIVAALKEAGVTSTDELRFESIGPTIGKELRRKTGIAVTVVVLAMIGYLAYEFRRTKGLIAPWQFGVAASWALLHDLILITALFVVFGKVWGATIDTLFVTAQLAILGYSVNDTIVVFERLTRERTSHKNEKLSETVNRSVGLTLGRSINTGFTTLLMLIALLFFGGSTLRWFVVALSLGVISGTYSSIFVASPFLIWLTERKRKRK